MLLQRISIILFTLMSVFFLWFGWIYSTVDEPLWFHAAAVPDHAREAVRPLYFALMTLIGGASIGLGALGLFVTWTAVRRRRPGAAAALSIAFIIPLAYAAATAERLAAAAGAPTSWRIMGLLIAATVAAFAAHAASSGKR